MYKLFRFYLTSWILIICIIHVCPPFYILQHPKRREDRCFVTYKPPPQSDDPALEEEFLDRANFIADDLDWLLSLPHDKFWCQIIFDETLQNCLESYLRFSPRNFDERSPSKPAVMDVQNRIHHSVFLTFLRMSTYKESKDNFFTPSAFGELIYNNFLFDVPKILDLCVLYGKGNSLLLQKMIGNIFTQQPSYYNDLNETVPTILQVLDTILNKFGLCTENATEVPQKLGSRPRMSLNSISEQELQDMLFYLCDTSTTLFAFLDVFPNASNTLQKHDFLLRLASFYELAVPELENTLKKRKFEDKSLQHDLWKRLSHSKKKIIEISHIIINYTCLQPILENSSEKIQTFVEDFLQTFTALLHEKRFLVNYDELFPIVEDISLLQQASPVLDETRTSYIIHAVESAWQMVGKRKASALPAKTKQYTQSVNKAEANKQTEAAVQEQYQTEVDNECLGATAACVTGVELDSLISQVKDLLPELGEGFILACLEEYNYSTEQVINNILEDRLAPSLQTLDRSLPRQVKEEKPSPLSRRCNVYDGDEFDVFSRDTVDTSRIWKGRKKGEDAKSLLNDKSHISQLKGRYEQYSIVVEEVPVQPEEEGGSRFYRDDYEDEYDDTYDSNQVGANDADSDDELISRRPFTIPLVLRNGERDVRQDEDEEEEEVDEQTKKEDGLRRDYFVQDPAVLRERAEARRAAQYARKGHRFDNSSVVGNTKGQGQSKETLLERRRKEANKSLRGNHNRRTMADRKRNKGMIPS
ncbi:activating signal cointegrator 1 complex subunit 2 [Protopterus annectens]|uniref:activating signal cointegrator 1 complex subunit 2 n=1 Tax=Protopterus annectens TaxID=7888 RepID=UPI001CFB6A91|nr:activating signal cointegrator 1 complex subunit 2 [Protopterus annectens]